MAEITHTNIEQEEANYQKRGPNTTSRVSASINDSHNLNSHRIVGLVSYFVFFPRENRLKYVTVNFMYLMC